MRKIWLPACNVIGLLFLLAILGQAGLISSVSRPLPNGFSRSIGFVTRSGTHLMLNGQPFRFAGANIHWLALDDSTTYPSQFRINNALDAAKEMGLTVIRSHDVGISTGCPNYIEPSLDVFNETAFSLTFPVEVFFMPLSVRNHMALQQVVFMGRARAQQ